MSETRQAPRLNTPTPLIEDLNDQPIGDTPTVDWTFTVSGSVASTFAGEYVVCRLSYPPGFLSYRESDGGTGSVVDNEWECTFTEVVPPYDVQVGLTAYLYGVDGTPIDSSPTLRITVHKSASRRAKG